MESSVLTTVSVRSFFAESREVAVVATRFSALEAASLDVCSDSLDTDSAVLRVAVEISWEIFDWSIANCSILCVKTSNALVRRLISSVVLLVCSVDFFWVSISTLTTAELLSNARVSVCWLLAMSIVVFDTVVSAPNSSRVFVVRLCIASFTDLMLSTKDVVASVMDVVALFDFKSLNDLVTDSVVVLRNSSAVVTSAVFI